MKRYFIPIVLAILVLASGLGLVCNSNYEKRMAELERQVAALTKQVEDDLADKQVYSTQKLIKT